MRLPSLMPRTDGGAFMGWPFAAKIGWSAGTASRVRSVPSKSCPANVSMLFLKAGASSDGSARMVPPRWIYARSFATPAWSNFAACVPLMNKTGASNSLTLASMRTLFQLSGASYADHRCLVRLARSRGLRFQSWPGPYSSLLNATGAPP